MSPRARCCFLVGCLVLCLLEAPRAGRTLGQDVVRLRAEVAEQVARASAAPADAALAAPRAHVPLAGLGLFAPDGHVAR